MGGLKKRKAERRLAARQTAYDKTPAGAAGKGRATVAAAGRKRPGSAKK